MKEVGNIRLLSSFYKKAYENFSSKLRKLFYQI